MLRLQEAQNIFSGPPLTWLVHHSNLCHTHNLVRRSLCSVLNLNWSKKCQPSTNSFPDNILYEQYTEGIHYRYKPVEMYVSIVTKQSHALTVVQTVCIMLPQEPPCIMLMMQKLHTYVFYAWSWFAAKSVLPLTLVLQLIEHKIENWHLLQGIFNPFIFFFTLICQKLKQFPYIISHNVTESDFLDIRFNCIKFSMHMSH